ncbi:MAG: hypothetical protein IJH84_13435, partial [Saccharopolyspora sp.]
AGLLVAPMIAASGADANLAAPLAMGAALFAVLAVAAIPLLRTAVPDRPLSPEVSDVLVRTR